jgi:hypothetical protein
LIDGVLGFAWGEDDPSFEVPFPDERHHGHPLFPYGVVHPLPVSGVLEDLLR